MPNRTIRRRGMAGAVAGTAAGLAAKQEPNVLFCMPNRTKCILLVQA
jgi:hypothetical protein